MTDRQKRLFERAKPYLSGIHQEAAETMHNAPVGTMTLARIPGDFHTIGVSASLVLSSITSPSVAILRDETGFLFRPYDCPYSKKGWTEPKWRRLHA